MPKFERVVHIRDVQCETLSTSGGVEVYRETGYISPSKGKPQTYVVLNNEVLHAFTSKLTGNDSELVYLQLLEMPKMVRSVRIDGRECVKIAAAEGVVTYRDRNDSRRVHVTKGDMVLYSMTLNANIGGAINYDVPYAINRAQAVANLPK